MPPPENCIFCYGCGTSLTAEEIFTGTGCECQGVADWGLFSPDFNVDVMFFPKNWVVSNPTCTLISLNLGNDKGIYSAKDEAA